LHEAGLSFLVGVVFWGVDGRTTISNYSGTPLLTVSLSEAAVTGSSRFKDALRAKIADHFEATLAMVGVVVAIIATATVLIRGDAGVALLFVVWFQGLILGAVWRHARLGREHLVRKLRVMLQDRVNNQLTVLVGLTDIHTQAPAGDSHGDVDLALTAARAVSREIEMLSIESLRSWEAQYRQHLPPPLR
jgi:hypothetical protein